MDNRMNYFLGVSYQNHIRLIREEEIESLGCNNHLLRILLLDKCPQYCNFRTCT